MVQEHTPRLLRLLCLPHKLIRSKAYLLLLRLLCLLRLLLLPQNLTDSRALRASYFAFLAYFAYHVTL